MTNGIHRSQSGAYCFRANREDVCWLPGLFVSFEGTDKRCQRNTTGEFVKIVTEVAVRIHVISQTVNT